MTEARRAEFNANCLFTKAPYAGPNVDGMCKVPCDSRIFGTKNVESRMYKIIKEYENSKLDQKLQQMNRSVANRKYNYYLSNFLS